MPKHQIAADEIRLHMRRMLSSHYQDFKARWVTDLETFRGEAPLNAGDFMGTYIDDLATFLTRSGMEPPTTHPHD